MAARSRANELAQLRFRKLLHDLGAKSDQGHGWKSAIARTLSVSQEHMSRLLAGKRRASTELLEHAARVNGFDPEYYSAQPERGDQVHYSEFVRTHGGRSPWKDEELESDPAFVRYLATAMKRDAESTGRATTPLGRLLALSILQLPMVKQAQRLLESSAPDERDAAALAAAHYALGSLRTAPSDRKALEKRASEAIKRWHRP